MSKAEFEKLFMNTPAPDLAAEFLQDMGFNDLIKAENNSPGKIVGPLRGYLDNPQFYSNARGVIDQIHSVPDNVLREVEKKNPIISACVNARIRQMREFSRVSHEDYVPGFCIQMKDTEAKPSKEEKKQISFIEEFFLDTGRLDFDGWEEREDNFHDFLVQMTDSFLVLDKNAIELRRDKAGKVVDFWILDPSTIKRVLPGGFRGNKADIDPNFFVWFDDKFTKKLVEDKVDLIPDDMTKIAFVQEDSGRYVAAFTRKDLIFDVLHKRADIRYRGRGYSPVEQAITIVSAFLYALSYNKRAFGAAIPKVGLAFKDGNFSPDQLLDLSEEWTANFSGVNGQWRVPVLQGDVTVLDIWKSPREMEYVKYLEMTGALTCAVLGIDPAEIGLRFQQAQNVLSENPQGKMKFSSDRALKDLLGGHASTCNKIMRHAGWAEKFVFKFNGIEPFDAEQDVDIDQKRVKTYMTVNELRASKDLKSIEGGDVILDPQFMQAVQAAQMDQEGGEEAGEGPDFGEDGNIDDIDSVVDEALDETELEKAKHFVRTRL